jgi:arylformamidase
MDTMITDWDDAYTNMAYIPDGASYPEKWSREAAAFRNHLPIGCTATLDKPYGDQPRQALDIFKPAGKPKGLVIFVHGGYWMKFSKDDWSHLAQGSLARGWAFALPGYTLAPEARISTMVREIARAIERLAEEFNGPLHLVGHSAGGHLAIMQMSEGSYLSASALKRLSRVTSISGVHDLRPLLRTGMNETLGLNESEAAAESPALLRPLPGIPVACIVGAAERPEFLRQTDLLANIWTGLGADITCQHVPLRHHFNVIDELCDSDSEVTKSLAP